MYFPTRIKGIKNSDKVLEVGPGNNPFYRSDVLLEKRYEDERIAVQQAGGIEKKELGKKVIYYDGGIFPFEDDAFDYVICSHVLEHIPYHELRLFIAELTRVASRGYLEFPLYRFEFINDIEYHVNLINVDKDNKIFIIDKHSIDFTCTSYRHLKKIIKESLISHRSSTLNPDRLCAGFEFSKRIEYELVDELDRLLSVSDGTEPYLDLYLNPRHVLIKIKRQFDKNIFLQKWYNRTWLRW